MPAIPIIMPQLGESIAEASVISFLVQPGEQVEADQDIIEVETNKATLNLAAPCRGRIQNFVVKTAESYPVGAVLGYLEASAEDVARLGLDVPAPEARMEKKTESPMMDTSGAAEPARKQIQPTVRGLPVPANAAGASYMSPRMKARMAELGFHAADLAGIAGSGAAGRVTIQDFEKFIEKPGAQQADPGVDDARGGGGCDAAQLDAPVGDRGIAGDVRPDAGASEDLETQTGPGALWIGGQAPALALAENSAPAGRLIGNKIVHPPAIDIGFAVEAEDGVLVPVIRAAERKPLQELVARYDELVELAVQRKLRFGCHWRLDCHGNKLR